MNKELLLYFALLLWFVVPTWAQPTILSTDYTVDANSIVEVDIVARDFDQLSGLQFAIDWDKSILQFITVTDFALPGAGPANYNISNTGKLRIQWFGNAFGVQNDSPLLTIRFQAIGSSQSTTPIQFMGDTNAGGTNFVMEMIDETGNVVETTFEDGSVTVTGTNASPTIEKPSVELFQNVPNPFTNYTDITFELEKTETITVSIFDTFGKEVFKRTAKYTVGQHHMKIENTDLPTSGIYTYQIRGAQYGLSKKLIFKK